MIVTAAKHPYYWNVKFYHCFSNCDVNDNNYFIALVFFFSIYRCFAGLLPSLYVPHEC